VAGEDVDAVSQAVHTLNDLIVDQSSESVKAEEVRNLFSDDNPYLRSLGAYFMAIKSDQDGIRKLENSFTQKFRAAHEILWIDKLLSEVVAKELRPTAEYRAELLRTWILTQAVAGSVAK